MAIPGARQALSDARQMVDMPPMPLPEIPPAAMEDQEAAALAEILVVQTAVMVAAHQVRTHTAMHCLAMQEDLGKELQLRLLGNQAESFFPMAVVAAATVQAVRLIPALAAAVLVAPVALAS